MNICAVSNKIPFTYLVTQKSTGKRYYESKYGKNCHPSDIGTKYFTSSKEIKKFNISPKTVRNIVKIKTWKY